MFIGFGVEMDRITENGKQLLTNILVDHKAQPWMPLSKILEELKARGAFARVSPGVFTGVLNPQLPQNKRQFQITQPGPIKANLTWDSKDCPLSMILNGPGQTGYYQRKDGPSPLAFEFAVTETHIAKGKDWTITSHASETLPQVPSTTRSLPSRPLTSAK